MKPRKDIDQINTTEIDLSEAVYMTNRQLLEALKDDHDYALEDFQDEFSIHELERLFTQDNKGSLNLEMALLIMLLALSVVIGLQFVGESINDVYAQAAGFFTAGSVSEAPTAVSTTPDGGSYIVDWEGGDAPFDVIEDGSVIADDTTPPFTYTPAPGVHEIIIRDNDGDLSDPVSVVGIASPIVSIDAGQIHTVGLLSDGSIVAVGDNSYGQCNVSGWTDIVAISAGSQHTVGLRSDGSIVFTDHPAYEHSDISDWSDIVAISAGDIHTVGLRSDGSVVATDHNTYGQCDVSTWTDIVAISAGSQHTVGLRSDGSCVAVGWNDFGQCDVSTWTDIVAISAGAAHTVGVRSDGSVVAVGDNSFSQGDVSTWTDVVAISAGDVHTVGVRSDGSCVATDNNAYGQCDVEGW